MFKVFKYAEVGDSVYSPIHENGKITKIESEKVYIIFEDGFDIVVDLDGKEHENQKNPSVTWKKYKVVDGLRLKDIIFHYVCKKPYKKFNKETPKILYFTEREKDWIIGKRRYWEVEHKLPYPNMFPLYLSDKEDNGVQKLADILTEHQVNYDDVFKAFVKLEWI